MINYTFIGDGSSDKALMKIIDWTLTEICPTVPVFPQFADLRHLRTRVISLEDKVNKALELYPCDILFIHRDAEDVRNTEQIFEKRKNEIQNAAKNIKCKYICVIPIKMMETWLLTDAAAIRKASGNRNGKIPISVPPISKLEFENNPKEKLHALLKGASGLNGRRLESFNVGQAIHLVAEYTNDFSPLRSLFSFQKFEKELIEVVHVIELTSGF